MARTSEQRATLAEQAAALRDSGLTVAATAAELGVGVGYARTLLYDPSGTKRREQKTRAFDPAAETTEVTLGDIPIEERMAAAYALCLRTPDPGERLLLFGAALIGGTLPHTVNAT